MIEGGYSDEEFPVSPAVATELHRAGIERVPELLATAIAASCINLAQVTRQAARPRNRNSYGAPLTAEAASKARLGLRLQSGELMHWIDDDCLGFALGLSDNVLLITSIGIATLVLRGGDWPQNFIISMMDSPVEHVVKHDLFAGRGYVVKSVSGRRDRLQINFEVPVMHVKSAEDY